MLRLWRWFVEWFKRDEEHSKTNGNFLRETPMGEPESGANEPDLGTSLHRQHEPHVARGVARKGDAHSSVPCPELLDSNHEVHKAYSGD